MTEQASNKKGSISEKDVCAYLREHNDFFVNNPELLEDLNLPHQRGEAISLVERQVALLRERNIDMRFRLGKLLDNARENDKLFEKTKLLVLQLLEGRSLPDLVDVLLRSLDRDFNVAFSSLIFFGDESRLPESAARVCSLHEAREAIGRALANNKILCGDFPRSELAFLFPESAEQVASAAVMPLVHGNCYGLLAIGSSDPQHYRSSMGTLFLAYIGEVLNRLLPRHLVPA